MTTSPATPQPILDISAGLWAAGVLKGAIELQVFDHVAAGRRTVEAMSRTFEASPEPLAILLDTLVSLGLLEKNAHGYGLTPTADEFLVSSRPAYIGGFAINFFMNPVLFDLYGNYRRVVTEGYRRDPFAYQTGANERVLCLTRQLFALYRPVAEAIAEHLAGTLDGAAPWRLLDVGCGSAVYGLAALTRLPQARLTAQDWPLVLAVAEESAARLGVAGRVQTLAGDMRTVDFGGPYDVVFLGQILHNYPEAVCRELLRKCLGVLAPGGRLVVIDFATEEGAPGRAFAWLFSTMMQATQGTRNFSATEIRRLLLDCGARRAEAGGGLPTGVVIGCRD